MPDDATEQRYRLAAAECMERAQAASSERVRTMFLALAQKWLELANSRFGMDSINRDRFSSAVDDFNASRLREH